MSKWSDQGLVTQQEEVTFRSMASGGRKTYTEMAGVE